MPGFRAQADAVVQDDSFVDKNSEGEQRQYPEDPAVPLDRIGAGQQENCGKQIPFMHLDAEYIEQDKQQGAQIRKETDIRFADKQGNGDQEGKCHRTDTGISPWGAADCAYNKSDRQASGGRGLDSPETDIPVFPCPQDCKNKGRESEKKRNGNMGGVFQPGPVGTEKKIDIRSVQRGIGVGCQGITVLVEQPS